MSATGPMVIPDETGTRAQSTIPMDIQKMNTFLMDCILSAIIPQKGAAKIATTDMAALMKPT